MPNDCSYSVRKETKGVCLRGVGQEWEAGQQAGER